MKDFFRRVKVKLTQNVKYDQAHQVIEERITKIENDVSHLYAKIDQNKDALYKKNIEQSINMKQENEIDKYIVPGYSQHGEDRIILSLFAILNIDKPNYIDIGASRPHHISNTALLYENGSRGINVEANPVLISAFQSCRPDDITINVGVGIKEDVMPFYCFDKIFGHSSFLKEHAEKTLSMHPDNQLSVIDIPVTTIKNIIDTYANGKYPHYMSIDIEGLDYDVLFSLDLVEGPIAITAEILGYDAVRYNTMMSSKGYVPYLRTQNNITYLKEKTLKQILFLD